MPTPRKATRELIEPLASQHTVSEMGRILGMSASIIARACEKFGIEPKRLKSNDYSQLSTLAETMYMAELARHYNVGYAAMCRTCHRLGIVPIKQTAEQKREVGRHSRVRTGNSPRTLFKSSGTISHKPKYQDDLAADYLRRFTHVYRCNERGAPDPKGTHWRYGGSIKTPNELIERARDKGWDDGAWKRIAA